MNKPSPKSMVPIALGLITLCGCQSPGRLGGNPASYHQKGEEVTVVVHSNGHLSAPPGPGLKTLPTSVGALAVEGIKYLLNKEAKRYTASYVGRGVQTSFSKLGGFTIERTVKINGQKEPAMDATFRVSLSGASGSATAFRLLPESMTVHKSKAKIPLGDKDLDLVIKVTIIAVVSSAPKQLASTTFTVKSVVLGEPKTFTAAEQDKNGSDWIPLPAATDVPYSLAVEVTETDDFGKWFSKAAALAESHKAKLAALLD